MPEEPTWSTLAHRQATVAEEIHRLMQAAYAAEAAILEVREFVPLKRTPARIRAAASRFVGGRIGGALVAAAEIERARAGPANVAALVVHPQHFRRGLGSELLRRVIAEHGGRGLTVSTGVLNRPALNLYDRFGFEEERRWRTRDGIPMLTLRRKGDA